jgi:hypothetical protein
MRYDAFHRKLRAKDGEAIRMHAAMSAAGVTVCSYRKEPHEIQRGETYATGAIQRCMREYGAQIITLALRAIVESRDGNPALIRADIVHAICSVLRMFPAWCARAQDLIDAFNHIDLQLTRETARRIQPGPGLWRIIATLLTHDLSHHLGTGRSAPHGQTATRAKV